MLNAIYIFGSKWLVGGLTIFGEIFSDVRTTFWAIVGAAVSAVVSWAIAKKYKKRKHIAWTCERHRLLSDKTVIKDFTITLNGNTFENPVIFKFAFWNDGDEAIKKEDIPDSFPATLSVKRAKIIDYTVLNTQIEINSFSVTQLESALVFRFNHLNADQGLNIEVVASATSTELEFDVDFECSIIGETRQCTRYKAFFNRHLRDYIFFYYNIALGFIFVFSSTILNFPAMLTANDSFARSEFLSIDIFGFKIRLFELLFGSSALIFGWIVKKKYIPSRIMLNHGKMDSLRWFMNRFLRRKMFP
jgi:hypothetical protein